MFLALTILALVLAALSGVPGLAFPRTSVRGERIAAALMVCAAVAGLAGAAGGLGGSVATSVFPWPAVGNGLVGLDALSAFFLVPVFLVGGLGPVYGLGYWSQRRHPLNGRKLRAFWGCLVAGMALLVISRHALIFLLGWEAMALSAFFLVSTEDDRAESRAMGWVYFVATHVSTLVLFALFALWRHITGSYALVPAGPDTASLGTLHLVFLLVLLGFGLKAGMMPLHFWLPGAHACAPSHVSAIMSGVVIKMGIYGMVRWVSLFPAPPAAWGRIILVLGAVSGLLGVVFAIGQHDLKRLLAYHSVENIGIILLGLGVAELGRATGRAEWVVLGLGGCLLHVWNHSLFKSLLFLCAGAVLHSTGTRQIDRLGGLAKAMPWTAACFLVGAVAICGLPPLNGFVSEWCVYLGMFGCAFADCAAATIGVPVLAAVGALAVACFVKVYGTVFLGTARTAAAARAHAASRSMRLPMLVLAATCCLIGLAPVLVVPALDAATACWMGEAGALSATLAGVVPLGAISLLAVVLTLGCGALLAILPLLRGGRRTGLTWDCGYARPTSRMQYTASSFAETITRIFRFVLRPHVQRPRVAGAFPPPSHFHCHVDEPVLDRALLPAGLRVGQWFGWCRRFQRGLTQHYLLYILLTLIALLCTLFPLKASIVRWFAR